MSPKWSKLTSRGAKARPKGGQVTKKSAQGGSKWPQEWSKGSPWRQKWWPRGSQGGILDAEIDKNYFFADSGENFSEKVDFAKIVFLLK